MKLLINTALFLFINMLATTAIAQKVIYTTGKGDFYSKKEYEIKRQESIEKFKSLSKRLKLYETLDTLSIKQDTLLIQYSWFFTDNMKRVKKEEERTNSYIGMLYPIEDEQMLDGNKIAIEDLKGKPTLINLWFTGCLPCVKEIPTLNNMYKEFGDKFNFLAITFEKRGKVQKFLEKRSFILPHVINAPHLTKKLFTSYPVNIFLDKEGKIVRIEDSIPYQKMENGKYDVGDGREFIKILEELL